YILTIIALLASTSSANAQLIERAERLIQSALSEVHADSVNTGFDTLSVEQRLKNDSIRIQEMALLLQEMKLNETLLRNELDNVRINALKGDSVKQAERRRYIDSLRTHTHGVPVLIDDDTLYMIYAERGGRSAIDRAEMVIDAINKAGKGTALHRDSVHMLHNDGYTDIMYGKKVIASVTDMDAVWEGVSHEELAGRYSPIIESKIKELRNDHNLWQIAKRVALFFVVIIVQYLLIRFTNYLFRKLRRKIIRFKQQRLQPIIFRDYELLNTRRLGRMLVFLSNLLRYLVLLVQLTISVPILFVIFPQTEKLALTLFHYIIEPIKMVLKSIVEYIPNLFIILVIWFCIRYIVKGIRYIAKEIEDEKLKISGFYPDWAQPTFNIIRFVLYACMIEMIYP
ncbi:MAG: mechanosensitive ion channel family protein, partial [Muribaculaceae bacterium]|nr:mechanosensitive ion channel family protein [Muribaculaceae bacterium]